MSETPAFWPRLPTTSTGPDRSSPARAVSSGGALPGPLLDEVAEATKLDPDIGERFHRRRPQRLDLIAKLTKRQAEDPERKAHQLDQEQNHAALHPLQKRASDGDVLLVVWHGWD